MLYLRTLTFTLSRFSVLKQNQSILSAYKKLNVWRASGEEVFLSPRFEYRMIVENDSRHVLIKLYVLSRIEERFVNIVRYKK